MHPPAAWYMLLTGKGARPPNFFCKRVAEVIDASAIKDAIIPIKGRLSPKSKPKTIAAPTKPSTTPSHCLQPTFSFKIGPANAFVSIGCIVTINAVIPVGIPSETE